MNAHKLFAYAQVTPYIPEMHPDQRWVYGLNGVPRAVGIATIVYIATEDYADVRFSMKNDGGYVTAGFDLKPMQLRELAATLLATADLVEADSLARATTEVETAVAHG